MRRSQQKGLWSSLGAEVDGREGLVGSNTKFRRAVLGATLHLLGQDKIHTQRQELQAIVSKHMHSVQFCRPLASIFDHLYREMAIPGGGGLLSDYGQDELILLSCLLPQHWLDQRRCPSGVVYATDASEDGAGACVTTGLSEWGHQRCHELTYPEDGVEGAGADDLLVIEVFAGLGGLKQALDLLGVMPQGVICIDNDATSKKITRLHCRHAIVYDDVKSITKEIVAPVPTNNQGLDRRWMALCSPQLSECEPKRGRWADQPILGTHAPNSRLAA